MGGVPVMGRSIEADVPRRPATLAEELRQVLAEPFDTAVFLTGVGARLLFEAAREAGLEDLLRDRLRLARVVARGPKPRKELRALRQRCDWTADPASTLLVRDRLLPDAAPGVRVLVQAFAEPPDVLTGPLRGARRRVPRPQPLRHRMAAGPDARPAPRPRDGRRRRGRPHVHDGARRAAVPRDRRDRRRGRGRPPARRRADRGGRAGDEGGARGGGPHRPHHRRPAEDGDDVPRAGGRPPGRPERLRRRPGRPRRRSARRAASRASRRRPSWSSCPSRRSPGRCARRPCA